MSSGFKSLGGFPLGGGVVTSSAPTAAFRSMLSLWLGGGAVPLTPTPTPTPTPGIGLSTPAYRAPVDFVFSSDYMAGVRVPKFRAPNKPIGQRRLPKQPENVELREMMGLYSMWREAA